CCSSPAARDPAPRALSTPSLHDALPIYETETQPDGSFLLLLPDSVEPHNLYLEVNRLHFAGQHIKLERPDMAELQAEGTLVLDDIVLARRLGISFWATTATFVLMLVLIATERLHKTLAALLAVAIIFTVSLVGGGINDNLYVD